MPLNCDEQFDVGVMVGKLAKEAVAKFPPCDNPDCAACSNMISAVAHTFLPAIAALYEALGMKQPASHFELAHAVMSIPGTHEKLVELAQHILNR
jgi:hypothetical protein